MNPAKIHDVQSKKTIDLPRRSSFSLVQANKHTYPSEKPDGTTQPDSASHVTETTGKRCETTGE